MNQSRNVDSEDMEVIYKHPLLKNPPFKHYPEMNKDYEFVKILIPPTITTYRLNSK